MKTLIAFLVLGLLGTQSAIINNNEINGPNNMVYYGEGNKLTGQDNKVAGYNNNLNGVGNGAIGKQNTLDGSNNLVAGYGNTVNGQENLVIGQGNLVIGPNSSQQDIQKVNQRLAEMFAARGLGNVMTGFGNVQSQPQVQVQPQFQQQTQVRTQNQLQPQTVTSPVLNQVQQVVPQPQPQVQYQPQPQVTVQSPGVIQSQTKSQPSLIQQTKPQQQRLTKTEQKQQVKIEQNQQNINFDTSTSPQLNVVIKQVPTEKKLQQQVSLDISQTEKPKSKQQSVVKLSTPGSDQKLIADNILFNDNNSSHQKQQQQQSLITIQQTNTLQITHQKQVPIQTVKSVQQTQQPQQQQSSSTPSPAVQQNKDNKLINLKQDKNFLFVIHDQSTQKKSPQNQKTLLNSQQTPLEKLQSEQIQVPKYRRVNHLSPQLRPSYPKINQNTNRYLQVVVPINKTDEQSVKKGNNKNNLRRNDDDNITGSQSVIIMQGGDHQNNNNNNFAINTNPQVPTSYFNSRQ